VRAACGIYSPSYLLFADHPARWDVQVFVVMKRGNVMIKKKPVLPTRIKRNKYQTVSDKDTLFILETLRPLYKEKGKTSFQPGLKYNAALGTCLGSILRTLKADGFGSYLSQSMLFCSGTSMFGGWSSLNWYAPSGLNAGLFSKASWSEPAPDSACPIAKLPGPCNRR